MGIDHCITVLEIWIYQIRYAADKTLTQRLLCLSPARKPANGLRTIDGAKVQKIHYVNIYILFNSEIKVFVTIYG